MNALMTHIVAGYPDMDTCEKLAISMAKAGVSYIEIQIPFSDPVADGPTIMAANQHALDHGITPEDCFQLLERIKKQTDIPILFMTYYNIPFRYGLEAFCKRASALGCYGFIIPDIPLDEEPFEHYLGLCRQYNLHAIQVVSPITPVDRLKKIAKICSGFVYCVARTGTTGTREKMNADLGKYLRKVATHIPIPLAVGFGLSSKEHVEMALQHADIAVMGSKVINMLNEKTSVKNIGQWLETITEHQI